jgi:HPt (histidine-containing phosphotransfer) domain-containing protein
MSEDEIAALRARFSERTVREAVRLRACLERGELGASEVERLAHKLSGTGGMLGLAEISAAAAAVDDRFAAGEIPTRDQLETLLAAMEALGSPR